MTVCLPVWSHQLHCLSGCLFVCLYPSYFSYPSVCRLNLFLLRSLFLLIFLLYHSLLPPSLSLSSFFPSSLFPSFLSSYLISSQLLIPLFTSHLPLSLGGREQFEGHIHEEKHWLLHCTVRLPCVRDSVYSSRTPVLQRIDGPWVNYSG